MSGSRTWQVGIQHIQIKESMGSDSMPYEPSARLRSAGTTERKQLAVLPAGVAGLLFESHDNLSVLIWK